MTAFDIIILIPIGIAVFKGYKKGLMMEVFGIAAFIGAIILGFKLLNFGAGLVEGIIGRDSLKWASPYLSFFIVFLPALFIIQKVGWMVKKGINLTFLGMLDGALGALLGAITSTFGVSLFLLIITKIGINLPTHFVEESKLYAFVADFAPTIISKISDWLPGGDWLDYLGVVRDKIK